MSKDIRKWTDGRYTLMFDEHTFFVWDNEKEERMIALETTKRLNEQQATIEVKDSLLSILSKENEELRQRIAFFEKQADEFEKYTAQTIQNMIANYRDGE